MRNQERPSQLIFLPGALGSGRFWLPLQAALPRITEMTLMSYPGFDGEPKLPAVSNFEGLVDHVMSRLTRPTAVIAQSMGGVLALEAILRRPAAVTHLVFIATSGGLDMAPHDALDWREDFMREHPDLPDWFAAYDQDLTKQLQGIQIPVLLIWGDRDPISPVTVGRTFLGAFPKAELHVIPNAGHDLAQTHAKDIAPLIRSHLQA